MCSHYLALGTKYATFALKYLVVLQEKWTRRQTFVTEHGKGWKRKHREGCKGIPIPVWGLERVSWRKGHLVWDPVGVNEVNNGGT